MIRAELLMDSTLQHVLAKHKGTVDCVLPQIKEAMSRIVSARDQLRRRFRLKQWTLTTGGYDHQNWGKTPKTRQAGGYLERFDSPKRRWSCQTKARGVRS